MSRMSAEQPKGDAWGIEDVIGEMTEKILAGEKSPIIPIIGAIDIKEIKVNPETGGHEAVVRIRRMESLTSTERIRKAHTILMQQVAERRGPDTVLPFEEQDIIERAFGGKPVGTQLQDDEEKTLDEGLTDSDRMLRHIVAVHDYDPEVLSDPNDDARAAAFRWHDQQHEADPKDRAFPDHPPESDTWRRVDLADLLGDAEEPGNDEDVLGAAGPDQPDEDDPDGNG